MKLSKKKVENACGCGNSMACRVLRFNGVMFAGAELSFSDVTIKDKDHPNKLPFKGVLLLLDQASTKPPHGARGHRILVPKDVAERNLDSLVGMGVNYEPGGLDSHNPRRKVGVITRAWITGNKVNVEGIIYKKDFPEAERDLKKPGMGMSMELADVYVRDDNEPVWYLQDFQFTGATILYRDSAAYYGTSLAARAAATRKGEAGMAQPEKKQKVAAAGTSVIDYDKLGATIGKAVSTENQKLVQGLSASVEGLGKRLDEVVELVTLQASAANNQDDDEPIEVSAARSEDDDDDDDDDMDAARSEDDSSDSSDPSDDDEEENDDEEELDAMEDLEEKAPHSEPGAVNHGMKTKGRKTTTTDVGAEAMGKKPFPNLKSKGMKAAGISAAAQIVIASIEARMERRMKKVTAINAAAVAENRKLKGKISRLEAQVQRYAEAEDRRTVASIPRDLMNLAAKSNVDLREIQASGAKLSVEQVDVMIGAFGDGLDITKRMEIKNRLLEKGLMEEGHINRGYTN